jgi:hypothetical protein
MGNKHAQYGVLRAFFHWLYSPRSDTELNPQNNPLLPVEPPNDERDKAIIALGTESGMRMSELTNIRPILTGVLVLSRYWGKV